MKSEKVLIVAFIFLSFFASVATAQSLIESDEFVSVELKRKDEDIKIVVQLQIHLIDGIVHCNGKPLVHHKVNALHFHTTIVETINGEEKAPRFVPVHVRVLAMENPGSDKKAFLVEEEFLAVDDHEVLQLTVQQLLLESSNQRHVTMVPMMRSHIHGRDRSQDQHYYYSQPRLPGHGFEGYPDGETEKHHHHHHHHGHHSFFGKIKCWYKRQDLKSKIAFWCAVVLMFLTLVMLFTACVKRCRNKRQVLVMSAPLDDTVVIDMQDEKKTTVKEADLDFHFEYENNVAVSDRQKLLE